MQNFDIKVTIIQNNPIITRIILGGFGGGGSITPSSEKLLGFIDPVTNIGYNSPGGSIIANPAIVSLTPPSVTGGYWIATGTANMNVDAVTTATEGNILFYLSGRRTEANQAILLDLHTSNFNNPHQVTKAQVGLGNANNTSDANKPISTATIAALLEKADLVAGKVPAAQLPSFVDDVLEFANLASFPPTGEAGKIYIALNTSKTFRRSGTIYVGLSEAERGGITGTLANQIDLQNALNGKANTIHTHVINDTTGLQTALDGKASTTHTHTESQITDLDKYSQAQTNALLLAKADLVAGKVPAAQLPSFVDDVLEFTSTAFFPPTGETGKIYIALNTSKTFRWSGTVYVGLSEAEWGAITGTLANQTDLQNALNAKINVLTPTVTLPAITFLVDRIHGLYLSPLTGNITASTTAGVAGVVCHIFHNQATVPTITGATKLSGEYTVSTLNFIQFMFDGTTIFYTITPNA